MFIEFLTLFNRIGFIVTLFDMIKKDKEEVSFMEPTLKSGIQTSEFLGVVIAQVVGLLVLTNVVPQEQAKFVSDQLSNVINAIIQLVTAGITLFYMAKPLISFIEGRTALKQAVIAKSGTTVAPESSIPSGTPANP